VPCDFFINKKRTSSRRRKRKRRRRRRASWCFHQGEGRAAVSFSYLTKRNSKAFVSHRKEGREGGRKEGREGRRK